MDQKVLELSDLPCDVLGRNDERTGSRPEVHLKRAKTESGEFIEFEFIQTIQRNGVNSRKSASLIADGFYCLGSN